MSLKKQPSDRFSDIGQFVEDEDGWWFGKGDGNHAGLQKRLADLGIVVPVRAPEDEKDSWFPAENAEFHATDTEKRYTGDGKNWVEQSSSGKSPNLDSVSAHIRGKYTLLKMVGTIGMIRPKHGVIPMVSKPQCLCTMRNNRLFNSM